MKKMNEMDEKVLYELEARVAYLEESARQTDNAMLGLKKEIVESQAEQALLVERVDILSRTLNV